MQLSPVDITSVTLLCVPLLRLGLELKLGLGIGFCAAIIVAYLLPLFALILVNAPIFAAVLVLRGYITLLK